MVASCQAVFLSFLSLLLSLSLSFSLSVSPALIFSLSLRLSLLLLLSSIQMYLYDGADSERQQDQHTAALLQEVEQDHHSAETPPQH